jgi:hypothetical protein
MIKNWLDGKLISFSEWLWLRVPTKGHLASASDAMAGGNEGAHLPKERKTNPRATERATSLETIGMVVGAVTTTVVAATVTQAQGHITCPDPYCYADGVPCSYCGGSQTSCPPGSYSGWYWPGCCTQMNPPTRFLFRDCCGEMHQSNCTPGYPWCDNAFGEDNWCYGPGGCPPGGCGYVCTMAEYDGPCQPDDPPGVYS